MDVVALLLFNKPLEWHLLDDNLLFHMGYLAIFTTLISTFIIQKTTVVLGPTKVMAYIYLSPLFVAILMWMFEGKTIPSIVLPGMILSISATVLLQLQNRFKKLGA
ncbi:EamA family transporter [Moritella dasanensis]|uniref:EamA family transporter n=1 Tax=Moritella dasanensis TaxID=428031 RepID=UPI0003003DDD|nr:EamA family transporter [Moritella dasanensis]